MKPQRISAWRTYSSRFGRFPGMSGGSATGFSNVLKCHQTVVTIFALFATKNSASLFRKFLNLVVLEIKEKKYHTRVWSGPDGWHQAPVVRACHQGLSSGLVIRAGKLGRETGPASFCRISPQHPRARRSGAGRDALYPGSRRRRVQTAVLQAPVYRAPVRSTP